MNAYLLSVIGTVLLSAILTAIIPEGKTATVIKGMTRLACLLAIIAPIPSYLKNNGLLGGNAADKDSLINFSQTVIETDEGFIKYYSEMRIRNAESVLEEEIFERYAVAVKVTLHWENENTDTLGEETIKITEIYVQTENGITEEVAKTMWEYLTKNYCSEVLIE